MAKITPKPNKSAKSPSPLALARRGANGKSKKQTCIALLKRPRGASLADLQKATGWQVHPAGRYIVSGGFSRGP